jgi:hypothetical protein
LKLNPNKTSNTPSGGFRAQPRKIRLVGRPKNQRDAEDQKGRRQRAQNQILDARLQGLQARALKTDQDIETDRDQFQRDEDHHKIIGRGREHHARQGHQHDDIKFPDAHRHPLRAFVGHEQDKNRRHQENALEKNGQPVLRQHDARRRRAARLD